MRKNYTDKFKFKVALAACLEKQTIAQLSAEYERVAPSLIHKWKAHLKSVGHQLFSNVPLTKNNQSKYHKQEIQRKCIFSCLKITAFARGVALSLNFKYLKNSIKLNQLMKFCKKYTKIRQSLKKIFVSKQVVFYDR